MRLGLGGQSSGHFSPASHEPAPKPAEQPSHPARQSGNTAGFLTRPTRDQQPRRRVPARATGAAELGQAGPICSEVPDEGREVREMCGWDLCGAREMLQAVHRKAPRRTLPEDLSDPGLLGSGEHGGRYRIRTVPRGPNRVSSPRRAHKEPEWPTARGLVPPTRARWRSRGAGRSVAGQAKHPPNPLFSLPFPHRGDAGSGAKRQGTRLDLSERSLLESAHWLSAGHQGQDRSVTPRHKIRGRPVDKSVGSRRSGSGFRALRASRLVSVQSPLNRDSSIREAGYLTIASCSGIHWSPRGVHVTRSRVA
jgi:hypothetical protein